MTVRFSTNITRHLVASFSALALASVLTGCGLTGAGSAENAAGDSEDRTISIIVTESGPFQEPTEIAKELLAEEGWALEPTYVTDIVQPNQVVSAGEYDANYFQHFAYLNQFNIDNDIEVEPAFSTYYEPAGLFSLQHESFDDLPEGAEISLPVDTANNGRGIKMLADHGVLEIDETVPVTELSQADITANPRNLQFVEIDQQSSGHTLADVDAGFAFARLVVESGHDLQDTALTLEDDPEVQLSYTNIVAVQSGNLGTEKTQALQDAYHSPEVQQWYDEYLDGAVQFTDDVSIDNVEQVWADFTS